VVESPRREASSPRIPSNEAKIHAITLWHFRRAPPQPPADPYQTGHRLPLEFPASSSPWMHKGLTIKNGQGPDRPRAHEARGLARNKLALTKED
jgi:hypothetical protein